MKTKGITRRNFIQKGIVTTGMASIVPAGIAGAGFSESQSSEMLPREVWIAGVSQMGLRAKTPELMVDKVMEILKDVTPYKPDFVCLPEVFPFTYVDEKTTPEDRAGISRKILTRFAAFSEENNCYTVCPVYTLRDGNIYNSAVVFDREGKKIGAYEKIHPTEGEIKEGYSCGPLFQPVIFTEFGPIGIQICFDIEWDDGWKMLRQQGAEIIFWPSAFAGGTALNTRAWQNKCVVASATNKNTAKLCDISGEVITKTGIWNPNLYCGVVNLEKVFLHTWPSVNKFRDIQKKYGRKVRITTYHEEEWTVIESLSSEIFVSDIMKEFDLQTHEELIRSSQAMQAGSRK